jgi:carboxypeptidase Q
MNGKRTVLFILLGFWVARGFAAGSVPADYQPEAQRLTQAATNSLFGFSRLATMCDTFGPRFTGSKNLESAIDWCLAEMKKDGFLNVRGEEVTVPRWVRGSESIELLLPRRRKMPMLGLGGSIGTPPEGIMADVLVVSGFDDLKNRASEVKGK